MTPEKTKDVLMAAAVGHAGIDTVEDWLAEQGIDSEVFTAFLKSFVSGMPKNTRPLVQLAVGFGLGWAAHEIMVATPTEAGPPPDLSESLE